ncbi:4-hydroxybenzoate polyprenyltransferase, mitochondrial [Halotydeus destructor]|nr:4-hydroxybenzoate polyprenyltransferase, mitochondrial [Halotydeus destructor]
MAGRSGQIFRTWTTSQHLPSRQTLSTFIRHQSLLGPRPCQLKVKHVCKLHQKAKLSEEIAVKSSKLISFKEKPTNDGKFYLQLPTVTEKLIEKRLHSSLIPYAKLMRIDKPTGALLLLWPSYWSIGLAASAGSGPDLGTLALFGLGAVLMRGAGCTINDIWDKKYDAKVRRTMNRPLASGQISTRDAVFFLGGQLGLSALILSTFDINSMILGASSLVLVATYPLSKRFTFWPQLMLGFTFNWGALLGWSVVSGGSLYLPAIIPLYASGIFWTLIYDTIYAHQDKSDDLMVGLKSTAIKFGDQTKPWLSAFSVGMVSSLVSAGLSVDQTWPYYLSVMIVASHLTRQIVLLDVKNSENCWKRFKENSQIGWILFVGVVLGNFLKKKPESVEKVDNDHLSE